MLTPILSNEEKLWSGIPRIPHTHHTIFIPLTQNDGNPQPPERLDWAEAELIKQAGGLTRYHPGDGLWMPPQGRAICHDKVVPFHVVMDSALETTAWLAEFVAEVARVFEQEEVFVFSEPVWLLDRVQLLVPPPGFNPN